MKKHPSPDMSTTGPHLASWEMRKKFIPLLHYRLPKFKDSPHAVLEPSLWLISLQILEKSEALFSTIFFIFKTRCMNQMIFLVLLCLTFYELKFGPLKSRELLCLLFLPTIYVESRLFSGVVKESKCLKCCFLGTAN